jgi:hypothetical protein
MAQNRAVRNALLALLVVLSTPAFAIYKCEKNGATSYSNEACPGGIALNTPTAPVDSSAAKRQLADEEKKLKQLERERHQQEKLEERERKEAVRAQAEKQKKCSSLARRVKWADEDVATSTAKANEKAKRKARRAAEQYETECRA